MSLLPPDSSVGPVTLAVPDLNRSVDFYGQVLGFEILAKDAATATLGSVDGFVLLNLLPRPNRQRPSRRSPGLFHFAVLLPTRLALGKALIHLSEAGWKLTGAGDHLVSEALYLDDPDGNGIELYHDRPRSTWHYEDGLVVMDTLRVNLDSLIAEAKTDPTPWTGMPAGTTMGHVHLKVSDLESAAAFYKDVVGFDLMSRFPQAEFLSVGGYHHHIGLNTWMSAGSPPSPEDSLGLVGFNIRVTHSDAFFEAVKRLAAAGALVGQTEDKVFFRDPSGNEGWITLLVAGGADELNR